MTCLFIDRQHSNVHRKLKKTSRGQRSRLLLPLLSFMHCEPAWKQAQLSTLAAATMMLPTMVSFLDTLSHFAWEGHAHYTLVLIHSRLNIFTC